MQGIIDFLGLIGQAIVSVIEFVISMIQDLVFVVQLAANFVIAIPSYFAWLPAPIMTMLVTAVTVIFIYKIAGRS